MSVLIKTSEEISPKIYAYTTPHVTTNDGWIKIGYTERQVEQRIKEQTHTAGIEPSILWQQEARYIEEPDKGKPFKDHDFHQFLNFHAIERRPKTEWFYFNGHPEKANHLFDRFVRHDVSGYQPGEQVDYQLRQEQEEAVQQTLTYIRTNQDARKKEFLWNAKPRFGKTLATYDLVKRLNCDRVLIVTNRPAIANSWFDDFHKFIAGSTSYKFVSESDSLKGRPALSREDFHKLLFTEEDAKEIAFLSLQDLKGSKYFGGAYDKLQWVAKTKWDLLVIDEAHEGVDTEKTDVAFHQIQRNFTLHLSGTPFKALAKGKFSENQIYNWSYADEQAAKQDWLSSSEQENPYENLPQLNMFTYQMSKMIADRVRDGADFGSETVDFAFDLNEFFATNESGTFIHEREVKEWLNTLTSNEKYPFSTRELRREIKHSFWLLDRVASAKALKGLLEDHPTFDRYKIVLAAGSASQREAEDTEANGKSLDMVRKAIAEHDYTITLSVGQLTTGVTIPEWTAVLMLSNLQSPSLYMQAAFRAQNPYSWVEGDKVYRKERAYVFDFAPERTLSLFSDFANNLSLATAGGAGTSQTREENIRNLLNFFPVIAEDREGKMVEIDAQAVMTIPSQIRAAEVIKRGFMSNFLFDNIAGIFSASQLVLDILDELPVEQQGKISHSSNTLEFPDIEVDEEGQVQVAEDLVINRQEVLFGTKVYDLLDTVEELVDQVERVDKAFVKTVQKEISSTLVADLTAGYDLTNRESKQIEKQIHTEIESLIQRSEKEFDIQQAHLENEYQEALKETVDSQQKEELEQAYQVKKIEAHQAHQAELRQRLAEKVQDLPHDLVKQQEVKQRERTKAQAEDEIRGHLRGFARTIPSFIMAYGDEHLTLANFDSYVPDEVFIEVTGINLNQFRYLRDGGPEFAGHLFDQPTFDQAIQEFLRKKAELANYFEDRTEDIFDYIPPQKTNQIFTPKKVVQKMVDELEKENPGIFDDPSKTFIDLYMKSGLYITELVKRLYNSQGLQAAFPEGHERLKHILEEQVYGFAPTAIIHKIALEFIFGTLPDTISRKNFLQVDTVPYAKEGRMQELMDKSFG
ncbi:DEAD/DEAH box helicase family protein [Streptococcus suis]|uniref:DEAD/DEAH box helicase family protein n=1 Tax=Streptococcus suis TaxID=1307 RepID=UPI001C975677|nr:DEAD/DEAH box helicase family protein [Streptococcus suis]MBY4961238.1 DEAD/DEAH box helicase family protein [Streptococcus suis]MBY4967561.1 DEAD/DEAH box helicase family protein [Streptococcus suis]MBY4978635.1 DEAD/DEAH box helicase family protein [Streptococcus suis]MBY4987144.1 DEAD/DEAH box helicase family protein [Streptococcus suis]MBY4993802.1 DEAD/DEAH box helicase family protein [Streptococcus suis]